MASFELEQLARLVRCYREPPPEATELADLHFWTVSIALDAIVSQVQSSSSDAPAHDDMIPELCT